MNKIKLRALSAHALLLFAAFETHAWAQNPPVSMQEPPTTPPHDHEAMLREMAATDRSGRASAYLLGQSSGTSRNPASWQMPMVMNKIGNWDLMWMGQAFVVDTQQSGPRGGDKFYSANWGMLGAVHEFGGGAVMLRGMVSLDPATITKRRYPLLFQTGESAYGVPIIDGQHPHDLFMEASIQYARPSGEHGLWTAYYAPVGDAAMGPVAFPHRASAMEIPQAVLGHHWEDSTHIAINVATAGVNYRGLRLEASGFHGREPDENRWNFDIGSGGFRKMDSWSTRFSYQPGANWLAQVSFGNLHSPEASHPGDVRRWTSSLQYTRPLEGRGGWSSTLVWARNYKTITGSATQAFLAESLLPLTKRDFLTGRVEWSQRDELFQDDHADEDHGPHGPAPFNVASYTIGYTREVHRFHGLRSALGANVTTYSLDHALKAAYGQHPFGVSVFLRFRLQGGE